MDQGTEQNLTDDFWSDIQNHKPDWVFKFNINSLKLQIDQVSCFFNLMQNN